MIWIALALLHPAAMAEDSEFKGTDEPGQKYEEPESTLSIELGGVLARGNTEFWSVNGLASGGHRWQRNRLSALAGINVGQTVVDADGDGLLQDSERAAGHQETARRYWAEGRYDRYIGERNSLYALVGGLVDTFAGYDLRTHEQLGYSRLLVDEEDTKLLGELGIDLAQENYVDGVDPGYQDILAARVLLGLSHNFSENVGFTERFELYENLIDNDDVRILNEAAFSSKMNEVLSLKLSHSLIFDNVPVDGFRKLDHTTMVTLVASIL